MLHRMLLTRLQATGNHVMEHYGTINARISSTFQTLDWKLSHRVIQACQSMTVLTEVSTEPFPRELFSAERTPDQALTALILTFMSLSLKLWILL